MHLSLSLQSILILNVDVDNRITSILLSTRKISKGYNYKGSLLALGGSEWMAGAFFVFVLYFFWGGGSSPQSFTDR